MPREKKRFVAIATNNGKVYFRLISELKKFDFGILSLTPGERVPLTVKLVVSTLKEINKINYPIILIYDGMQDPEIFVEKVIQLVNNKKKFKDLTMGVDPGKRIGIVVLGDGIVLKKLSLNYFNKKLVMKIIEMFNKIKAEKKVIKIGNGAREYQVNLINYFDNVLPQEVMIESVAESGTTKYNLRSFKKRKDLINISAAEEISIRNGIKVVRKNK